MICEMCGKDVPSTRPVFIEGTKLNVCPNCAKFGVESKTSQSGTRYAAAPNAQVIEERLQKREKRMQTKSIYTGTDETALVDDYGGVIKAARIAKGMDLDQFAASILEKKGTLAKIEANDLVPDQKMVKKLEKALGIKLTESVAAVGKIGGASSTRMSLGDFVRKE